MTHYVYILKSKKDKGWYIGLTKDADKRVIFHNKGRVKSTKNRRPLELIHSQKFDTKLEAQKAERYYKSGAGRIKLKKIISDEE